VRKERDVVMMGGRGHGEEKVRVSRMVGRK
jgi:hypothetical protein